MGTHLCPRGLQTAWTDGFIVCPPYDFFENKFILVDTNWLKLKVTQSSRQKGSLPQVKGYRNFQGNPRWQSKRNEPILRQSKRAIGAPVNPARQRSWTSSVRYADTTANTHYACSMRRATSVSASFTNPVMFHATTRLTDLPSVNFHQRIDSIALGSVFWCFLAWM